jgi:hypothetical protein
MVFEHGHSDFRVLGAAKLAPVAHVKGHTGDMLAAAYIDQIGAVITGEISCK